MKNDNIKSYTHVALVVDASGSMCVLRESTISTMKEFFESIKSPDDRTVIDLWQFDDNVKHLIDGKDIEEGAADAIENYKIGGCTALYDAICTGIDELGEKFAAMSEEERPDAVVFAILTDGFENASKKFTVEDVKNRITHQSEKYSWNFRFLAANQDAVLTGREMGLSASSCQTIEASEEGLDDYRNSMVSCCMAMRREARKVRSDKQSQRSKILPRRKRKTNLSGYLNFPGEQGNSEE